MQYVESPIVFGYIVPEGPDTSMNTYKRTTVTPNAWTNAYIKHDLDQNLIQFKSGQVGYIQMKLSLSTGPMYFGFSNRPAAPRGYLITDGLFRESDGTVWVTRGQDYNAHVYNFGKFDKLPDGTPILGFRIYVENGTWFGAKIIEPEPLKQAIHSVTPRYVLKYDSTNTAKGILGGFIAGSTLCHKVAASTFTRLIFPWVLTGKVQPPTNTPIP